MKRRKFFPKLLVCLSIDLFRHFSDFILTFTCQKMIHKIGSIAVWHRQEKKGSAFTVSTIKINCSYLELMRVEEKKS